MHCLSRMALLLTLVCVSSSFASAGDLWFEYSEDGPDVATAWFTVHLDPIEWGPCAECLWPDYSRFHVAPAPLDSDDGFIADESGAYVFGDGYVRRVLLDIDMTYTLSDALTRRSGTEVGQGGFCTGSGVGCLYEVIDYPVLEIMPITVSVDGATVSTLKVRYGD